MLKHYLVIALVNLRRSPFVAAVNVVALSLGIATFVAAYAVVAFWSSADKQFANSDRIYALTTSGRPGQATPDLIRHAGATPRPRHILSAIFFVGALAAR